MPDDLNNKSQQELEMLKLIEEIRARRRENDAKNPPEFEQTKFAVTKKIENRKLWVSPLITIILSGVISYLVSNILKDRELRNENIASATKAVLAYKAQFDTTSNNNDRLKLYLAEIIKYYPSYGDANIEKLKEPFISTDDRQDSIDTFSNIINQMAPVGDSSKLSPSAKAILNKSDAEEILLQNAKMAGVHKDSINKIRSVISDNKATNLPDSILQAINNVKTLSSKINTQFLALSTNAQNNVAKDYGIAWVKEGYFLLFDSLKVYLSDIDRNSQTITVNVCEVNSSSDCTAAFSKSDQVINPDSPLSFNGRNYQYKIYLKSINHAGHNPFTWAAYINVLKFSK